MNVALEMESLRQEPTTRQWVSPRLIEANHILGLALAELEQTVQAELEANPALDVDDEPHCPGCGTRLEGQYCATCHLDQATLSAPPEADDYADHQSAMAGAVDDNFDPMTLIASEVSLVERILSDVATQLGADDLLVAAYLLNSLDERGYLDAMLEQVAARFNRPIEDIESILRVIQQVAPVGVAARDIRECLLLQLAYLAQQPDQEVPAAVWPIVTHHLESLAAHRYTMIARKLGLTTANVSQAHEFIRTALTPFPLQNGEARWWKTPIRSPFVVPDVIILLRDGEFQIELIQSRATRLRLNPLYARLATDISSGAQRYAAEESRHIHQYVTRAKLFLANIAQRRETLRKITECLLELQRDFMLHGVRSLQPLTRGMVAERVGVHESTVSRATSNKYLMLPDRRVIPFSTFFVASLGTKDIIREMIEREPQALTDQEICDRLRRQGIRIARRTVAKYRATIGIPSSLQRTLPSD